MEIYPAMDLYEGRVIRLAQGDFSKISRYEGTPEQTARSFAEAGARWIHLIDLEGAKKGKPCHLPLILEMKALGLSVQYGGGLRSALSVEEALQAGADRVYVGSLLGKDPTAGESLRSRFGGERIIPAVDIRNGAAAVNGWQSEALRSPEELLLALTDQGYSRFLVTAVSRDGMGQGADLELYRRLAALLPKGEFIAAGGISSPADLKNLEREGLWGAVIGKALYEGGISLSEIMKEVRPC
ncbi:MAG: 1-(5-phosphoribosyl)-5-[(5-phosphoribosylamino)methylideneamino] imidazole-4-carboxamide isomerase [Synergistaceae bacterium]|nr:1-(5-phosphoribosyl)-5-[(5-phosphoribosylamino)methylideneamino] imidazole-4-carboxamide isomerase [Synergistaceae bacterium]